MEPPPNPARFTALAFAIHARQTRKGTDTRSIAHLLAVVDPVLEHGGD